jgi:hypothetical protein
METHKSTTWSRLEIAPCPACAASLTLHRSALPHIDECGFEAYAIDCTDCGAPLAGIIDPADDALLLFELPR